MSVIMLQNKYTLRHRFETAAAEHLRGDIMPLVIAPDEYQLKDSQKLAWDMVRHAHPDHPNFEDAQIRITRNMMQAFMSARHAFDQNAPHDFIRKEFRGAINYLIDDAASYLEQKPESQKKFGRKLG